MYLLEGAFFIYLKLPMQLKSAMQSLFYDSFLDLTMFFPGVPLFAAVAIYPTSVSTPLLKCLKVFSL